MLPTSGNATPAVGIPISSDAVQPEGTVRKTTPDSRVDLWTILTSSGGQNQWSAGLCAACQCGTRDKCTLNGYLQECCFGTCVVYSSAVSLSGVDLSRINKQLSEMDERQRCQAVYALISLGVVPFQTLLVRAIIRLEVARKYGIEESVKRALCLSCCCQCCSDGQVVHEIMVRENLIYGSGPKKAVMRKVAVAPTPSPIDMSDR